MLSEELGFELRWTLPSDDIDTKNEYQAGNGNGYIILQLISRTANDRYLAFGIRSDDAESQGIPFPMRNPVIMNIMLVLQAKRSQIVIFYQLRCLSLQQNLSCLCCVSSDKLI